MIILRGWNCDAKETSWLWCVALGGLLRCLRPIYWLLRLLLVGGLSRLFGLFLWIFLLHCLLQLVRTGSSWCCLMSHFSRNWLCLDQLWVFSGCGIFGRPSANYLVLSARMVTFATSSMAAQPVSGTSCLRDQRLYIIHVRHVQMGCQHMLND